MVLARALSRSLAAFQGLTHWNVNEGQFSWKALDPENKPCTNAFCWNIYPHQAPYPTTVSNPKDISMTSETFAAFLSSFGFLYCFCSENAKSNVNKAWKKPCAWSQQLPPQPFLVKCTRQPVRIATTLWSDATHGNTVLQKHSEVF